MKEPCWADSRVRTNQDSFPHFVLDSLRIKYNGVVLIRGCAVVDLVRNHQCSWKSTCYIAKVTWSPPPPQIYILYKLKTAYRNCYIDTVAFTNCNKKIKYNRTKSSSNHHHTIPAWLKHISPTPVTPPTPSMHTWWCGHIEHMFDTNPNTPLAALWTTDETHRCGANPIFNTQ